MAEQGRQTALAEKKSSKPKPLSSSHSFLRSYKRFDHFEQPRVEPNHYPSTIGSLYKKDFTGMQPQREQASQEASGPKLYKNSITGLVSAKRPQMDTKTTNQRELDRKTVEKNDLALRFRQNAEIDHLTSKGVPEGKWRTSTEYRDSLNPEGKEVATGVLPGRLQYPPRPPVEKSSVYAQDYTMKHRERGFVDPKETYKQNLQVVKAYLSANNTGVGKGFVHPARDGTSYKEAYLPKAVAPEPVDPHPLQRLSPFNNWKTSKANIEGNTVYQQDYIYQKMVAYPPSETASVAATSKRTASAAN